MGIEDLNAVELQQCAPPASEGGAQLSSPHPSKPSTSSIDAEPAKEMQKPLAGLETPQELTGRHIALLAEMLLLTLSVMATETTISPALPRITNQYPEYSNWVPWTLSIYNVVGAVWTPIAGSLGDIFGVKWLALFSLVTYLIGEIGCALSRNIFVLIAFRGVQGVGMGIFVLCFTAIKKFFPPRYVPIALGIVSSMFSVGLSFGLVGGAGIIKLLKHTRWEYVFFVYCPFLVAVIIAFYFTMPDIPRQRGRKIDFIGALLIGIAVVTLLVGLTLSETRGWDGVVIGLIVAAIVVFVVFIVAEMRIADPLVDLRHFCTRNIFTIGLVAFLIGVTLFSAFQVLPYLYEYRLGVTDSVQTGLMLLPVGLMQLPIGPISALSGKKFGFYWTVNFALIFITTAFGLYIGYHDTKTQSVLINVLFGCGMGGVMVSLTNIVSENSTPQQFGSATGTNTLLRILGGAVGPVVVNLILYNGSHKVAIPTATAEVVGSDSSDSVHTEVVRSIVLKIPIDSGYTNSFIMMCISVGLALLVAQLLTPKFRDCSKPAVVQPKLEPESTASDITVLSIIDVVPQTGTAKPVW